MAKRPARKRAAPKARAKTTAAQQGRRLGKRTGRQYRADGATAHDAHGATARKLREALMAELETVGWHDLSFADIVAKAGVPMAEAYAAYQSKLGVLCGVLQATDQAVLESLANDPLDGSPRDRLFDLIMRRLDQHHEDKAAFAALSRDLRYHPTEAICLSAQIERSMAMLLDLAKLPNIGLRGALRSKILTALYLHVFAHWLKDDSVDSESTMALLDRRLDQAERLLGFLPHHHHPSRHHPGRKAAESRAKY